jgi:DNA polymerase III gamma/tau subunit
MMESLIKTLNEFLPILTALGGGLSAVFFFKWKLRRQRNGFEVEELTALQQVIRESSASLAQLSQKVMELEMLVTKLDAEKNQLRRENNALTDTVGRLERLLTHNDDHPTIMEGGPTHTPKGGRTARKSRNAPPESQ